MYRPLWRRTLLATLVLAAEALAERRTWPAPPFEAEVSVATANIRPTAGDRAAILGTVQRGARLAVVDCVPDCNAEGAWAILTEGAIAVSKLGEVLGEKIPSPLEQHFLYGTVLRRGAAVYERPDPRAKILEHLSPGLVIALQTDELLADTSWMRRVKGGFVRSSDLRFQSPSRLQGEKAPRLPLAFVWRDSKQVPLLPKYGRFAIVEELSNRVRGEGGLVPKSVIRVARRYPRPREIPIDAKWVHVDPSEQTLVAYQGDSPVFATLVSTGAKGRETPMGLHRVWLKTSHDLMHGTDYYVEEVPYPQYFARGSALHAAFWHDRFGRAITHGCINLSMADAEWLFNWSPPTLPDEWHSIIPPPDIPTLWVLVANAGSAPTLGWRPPFWGMPMPRQ